MFLLMLYIRSITKDVALNFFYGKKDVRNHI